MSRHFSFQPHFEFLNYCNFRTKYCTSYFLLPSNNFTPTYSTVFLHIGKFSYKPSAHTCTSASQFGKLPAIVWIRIRKAVFYTHILKDTPSSTHNSHYLSPQFAVNMYKNVMRMSSVLTWQKILLTLYRLAPTHCTIMNGHFPQTNNSNNNNTSQKQFE